ncbi:hypothetical protein C1Y14_34405, partial [Pseudomonas sp. MPR-R5B]
CGLDRSAVVAPQIAVGGGGLMAVPAVEAMPPLCVDLDGTLIKSDVLLESLLLLLKKNPFYLFLLPLWLLRGKAMLKGQIAARVSLD